MNTKREALERDTCVLSASDGMQMANRAAWSSITGSALEWLDFAAYGAIAATVLPQLFFSKTDPTTGALAAFATLSVGFGTAAWRTRLRVSRGSRWPSEHVGLHIFADGDLLIPDRRAAHLRVDRRDGASRSS